MNARSSSSRAPALRGRLILRVRFLSVLFVIAAVLLVTRLYFVQVVHGDTYRAEAAGQYVETAPEFTDRGEIRFTKQDGEEVAAAVMQSGWRIALQPKEVTNPEEAYERIAAIVPLDRQRFMESAAKKDDPYEEVAFRLSDQEGSAVDDMGIPGVLLVRDQWRMYPAGELAANVLGFVGYRGDTKEGVYGLERYYEDTLKRGGSSLYVNPFAEIFTNVQAALSSDPAAHEGSIITSIEPAAQARLEDALDDVVSAYHPSHTGGIVMDPKSGAIYAMAVRPTFDPNTYNTTSDPAVFTNPIVESRYEMGSIMKALTMAAGIDSGAVRPETTYDDTGCIVRSGSRVCNYDGVARGVVSMQEVLDESLNVGATFIAEKMGHAAFASYMQNYKLGEETGIDLPHEIGGNIQSLAGNADIDFASASFGQGIAVTPIEMIRALAALANGGKLPQPYVATAVRYPSGITRPLSHPPEEQVLKPETAATVTDMLIEVFDDALLGGELKEPHYSIAAKTGTAQIADHVNGGYYTDRYLHSFFGYFPARDPQFIILLYAVDPHGEQYASHTLSRPFAALAKFLINYYDVPPDR